MPQPHPLDAMLQLQPQPDGSFVAHTHAGYANMVGPYGGATAALLLHSVLQHPDCLGQPLSLTVNFAGAVQDGAMHLVPRAVRTNRSTQHWVVELRQTNTTTGQEEITTTATVVTAVRRATFSADAVAAPGLLVLHHGAGHKAACWCWACAVIEVAWIGALVWLVARMV